MESVENEITISDDSLILLEPFEKLVMQIYELVGTSSDAELEKIRSAINETALTRCGLMTQETARLIEPMVTGSLRIRELRRKDPNWGPKS